MEWWLNVVMTSCAIFTHVYSLIWQITRRSKYSTTAEISKTHIRLRIIIVGLRNLGHCPCPRCLIPIVMEQPLVLSHLILSTLQFGCIMEQPLSLLSYLFDLINYASLILLNKLSILFHPIIVWPCGQYYKVQGWAHV